MADPGPNADKVKSVGGENYDLGNDGFIKIPEKLAKKHNLNPNEQYWVKVDKNTGNVQVWNEEWGFLSDRDLGTYNMKENTFAPNDTLPGGFGASDDEIAMLNDPEAMKYFKGQAQTVVETKVKEDLKEVSPDISDEVAAAEAENVSDNLLLSDDQKKAKDAAAKAAEGEAIEGEMSKDVDAAHQRKEYDDIMYPIDMNTEYQDFIQFQMIQYIPRKHSNKGGGGGLPSRQTPGLQTVTHTGNKGNAIKGQPGTTGTTADYSKNQNGERKILATMTLPIPAGIADQNSVNWGEASMDMLTQNMANLGADITAGGGGGDNSGANIRKNLTNESTGPAIRAALLDNALAGADFAKRNYGAILNQNMELLFNGPKLRGFSFTFRMSPRSADEAKAVRGIIRQFKQGMSPKKGKTFTFIKAPHTFFIGYYHKGSTSPWLNMFKECALESMSMSYTPDGQYSTFTDGALTSYQMQLSFKELEPVFDSDYDDVQKGNDIIGY